MIKKKSFSMSSIMLAVTMLFSMSFQNLKIRAEGEADTALFNFEDSTLQGFTKGDGTSSGTELTLSNDSTIAYAGTASMKLTYTAGETREIRVNCPQEITAGSKVTFHIYIPSDQDISFQPFILDNYWGWSSAWIDAGTMKKDTWNEVSFNIPSTARTPINILGLQIKAYAPTAGSIWIDSITAGSSAVDKSVLDSKIKEAMALYETSVEGDEAGQYEQGARGLLKNAVDAALLIMNNPDASQLEVYRAVSDLEWSIGDFKAKRISEKKFITIGLKAEVDKSDILLSWNAVENAGSYTVSRSTNFGGPFTDISQVAGTSFRDTNLAAGNTYYYIIKINYTDGKVESSEQVYERILGKLQLKDLRLLQDKLPYGWTGGDNNCIDTVNENLPMDYTKIHNNLPSAHVRKIRPGSWWVGLMASNGWDVFSIEQYYEKGSLEFNVKGARGGEKFNIGFEDHVMRHPNIPVTKPVSDYVNVTTDWQHVSIPLKELINKDSGFELNSVRVVRIGNADDQPVEFWINDIRVTSPDNEKNYPAVKVNQLGYTTSAEKYALVSGFDKELKAVEGDVFRIKNALDNNVVYTGELKLVTNEDLAVSGERVLKAEFSSLTVPGTYYMTVGTGETADSPEFQIGDNIYDQLLADASKYYYYQRSGMSLEAKYAGEFERGVGHPQDSSLPLHSQMNNADAEKKDVSGGWYDAGDYGKYTNAGALAVSDLLWAYEMFPERFKDNQLNIPESGNGIADILDEVKYEMNFLLKMQDEKTGGFYGYVWPQNAELTPDRDSQQRYIEDTAGDKTDVKSTPHTADVTAALAHGYIVLKDIDPAYAKLLLSAALHGWAYLEQHPGFIPSKVDGAYYDDDDKDNRLWAAAALFRATGEEKYNTYFINNYTAFSKTFDEPEIAHGVGRMELIAFLQYMKSDKPDNKVKQWFKEKFKNWSDVQLERSEKGVWRNTLTDKDYYWGSNMTALNITMVLAIGNSINGGQKGKVVKAARANLNYVLGINPLSFSYVSGYGENSVKNSYSNSWGYDGVDNVPKGVLAGGSNRYEGSWFSRFAGKCYVDSSGEWTTNEQTIYWNSGLVFNTALIIDKAQESD